MNLTIKFSGHVADVINKLVEKGVVATKTEALRLGILELEKKYLSGEQMGLPKRPEKERATEIL